MDHMIEITAMTHVEDLVEAFPKAVRILAEHNIVCIRCGEPYWGTLGELAADKGITDLDPIIQVLQAELIG